ncbi:NfeD family protein [Streptomyces bullii]|uniref:Nodulation protein NfeD n=1 Tax=Streptomyces bullii TaxID=349910 RepID=A0ABW0UXI3_9ACTN
MLGRLLAAPAVSAAQSSSTLLTMRIDGPLTPVVADHLEKGLRTAERDGHQAVLVELDTPGGLLESTRKIVQDVLASEVPVIVYVTPSGASAASAGACIALSAHAAAMAPGTHVAAGTPVTGKGKEGGKLVYDVAAFAVSIAERRGSTTNFARGTVRDGSSVSDQAARRSDVVDLVAPSRDPLLTELDGRRAVVGPEDAEREIVPRTAGTQIVEHEPGFFGELRQLLARPELAYLFLSIGTLAVICEPASTGMGSAGVIGVIPVSGTPPSSSPCRWRHCAWSTCSGPPTRHQVARAPQRPHPRSGPCVPQGELPSPRHR